MTDFDVIREAIVEGALGQPMKDEAVAALDRLKAELADRSARYAERALTRYRDENLELENRIETTGAELDALRQDVLGAKTDARAWKDSCKEAEAAAKLLREALEQIAESPYGQTTNVGDMARAALAKEDV